ncbi:MAG: DinB family protein [Blastocatellia bacterium]
MTRGNIYLLRQALNLLDQLDDDVYARVPSEVSKAGIGGHLRHCLDFYGAFLRSFSQRKIDYDLRERNELVEKDRSAASAKIETAIAELQQLPAIGEDQELLVKLEGQEADDSSAWNRSSIRRELQFLLSHTVHHYALISMLLRSQGFQPAADFGVAPSTLKYWQAKA